MEVHSVFFTASLLVHVFFFLLSFFIIFCSVIENVAFLSFAFSFLFLPSYPPFLLYFFPFILSLM